MRSVWRQLCHSNSILAPATPSTTPRYSSQPNADGRIIKVTASSREALKRRPAKQKLCPRIRHRPSLLRCQLSPLLTHIQSSLPATPTAWTLTCLSLSSSALLYELRLQKSLSAAPDVFCTTSWQERARFGIGTWCTFFLLGREAVWAVFLLVYWMVRVRLHESTRTGLF
jgi:hypothetical protein